jgi:hypothetical protein
MRCHSPKNFVVAKFSPPLPQSGSEIARAANAEKIRSAGNRSGKNDFLKRWMHPTTTRGYQRLTNYHQFENFGALEFGEARRELVRLFFLACRDAFLYWGIAV